VIERRGHEGVVNDVLGGVGRRERDGTDAVCRRESPQNEHERLPAPARQQIFEHRDAALAIGADGRDPVVHGKRADHVRMTRIIVAIGASAPAAMKAIRW
jgi:hypothetical protein